MALNPNHTHKDILFHVHSSRSTSRSPSIQTQQVGFSKASAFIFFLACSWMLLPLTSLDFVFYAISCIEVGAWLLHPENLVFGVVWLSLPVNRAFLAILFIAFDAFCWFEGGAWMLHPDIIGFGMNWLLLPVNRAFLAIWSLVFDAICNFEVGAWTLHPEILSLESIWCTEALLRPVYLGFGAIYVIDICSRNLRNLISNKRLAYCILISIPFWLRIWVGLHFGFVLWTSPPINCFHNLFKLIILITKQLIFLMENSMLIVSLDIFFDAHFLFSILAYDYASCNKTSRFQSTALPTVSAPVSMLSSLSVLRCVFSIVSYFNLMSGKFTPDFEYYWFISFDIGSPIEFVLVSNVILSTVF